MTTSFTETSGACESDPNVILASIHQEVQAGIDQMRTQERTCDCIDDRRAMADPVASYERAVVFFWYLIKVVQVLVVVVVFCWFARFINFVHTTPMPTWIIDNLTGR